ncbi:MAG: pimeloyl-ACP methyl ester carboxylesterase [Marinobacter maritimus]|jgi:pimeloyl-ACP methyl ester carboxylesterase|nr:alpha/beta hydrolase [Oceanospirillales bacterium]
MRAYTLALEKPDSGNRLKHLILRDGRTMAYTDLGHPQGYPLIFGHGMPGSRLQGRLFHNQALRHGFRFLTPDRPGIGSSSDQPERRLLDYPQDILQLADALGLERFTHIGWSSGGSRALACCHSLSDRMDLGVCLSGYTNFSEYDGRHTLLEKTRWPGPLLARYSPKLTTLLVRLVAWLSLRYPGLYMREARKMVNASDRDLMGVLLSGNTFRQDQLVCLESGGKAIAADLLAELSDWGFSLKQVSTHVLIFQGEQDAFVPLEYARHLAEQLPNAELILLTTAGHLYPLDEKFQARLFERIRRQLTDRTIQKRVQPS